LTGIRFITLTAGACLALAVASPSFAQGKGGGKKPPKSAAPPPSTSALSSPINASPSVETGSDGQLIGAASPFAWLDDASLIDSGSVWVGVSMLQWYGGGLSETMVPVIDAAVGLTPRVQLGVSVPRVAGGVGTTFFSGKIGLLGDSARAVQVAVTPTLEVAGGAVLSSLPAGQSRTQWGLPVSVHADRDNLRVYASSGYFSPGIWYAGAGVARAVGDRLGVSGSFSRAWAVSSASDLPVGAAPRRHELSGGASYDLWPNIALFGSIGRTLATSVEDGAGTTLSLGLSVSAVPRLGTN
jgi:hypothetical protein